MRTGSKVICVNDLFPKEIIPFYKSLPIKDHTYIIRDMGIGVAINGQAGEVVVYLEGMMNPCSTTPPFPERGFSAERFTELQPPAEVEAEELAEASA
jgi:hypothetical protein